MLFFPKPVSALLLMAVVAALGGCGLFQQQPTPPVTPVVAKPAYDQVAAIRAAGAREQSVISVNPLIDPGIGGLVMAATVDENAGRYTAAAAKLDQALQLSPQSPDLLQGRAEMAVRLKDYPAAERLAHESWSLGPQLGPLCARNWQTIVEMRLQANDAAGAASARKWLQQCHKPGQPRY